MYFKIKSASVSVSFTFFAVILLAICFDNEGILLISILSSFLHEAVHIILILICGGGISEFSLTLFGGKIERKQNLRLSNSKEAIISLSAPAINIIAGALTYTFGFEKAGLINLIIGTFNILPFYDFDGGRGLFYILSDYLDHSLIRKITDITSVISVILISFFTITLICNRKPSFSFIVLCLYMFFTLFRNISTEKSFKNI